MKRIVSVLALLLLMVSPSFALSDSEYLRMRRNSVAFARADKKLNRVWSQLKKSLPRSVFTELDKVQREWITSGRDTEAEQFMDEGYSRVEAYTMVTNDRADSLPNIAKELRASRRTTPSRTRPAASRPKPKPEPEPEPEPEEPGFPDEPYEPEPEPVKRPTRRPDPVITRESEPEPEPEEPETEPQSETVSDPSGEYRSDNGFMTVKILDASTMEAEVVIGRWKDEISWKSRGWIEDNVLELSDSQYIRCVVTIVFDPDRARVTISESDDWAKATADDFVIRGTYTKN